MPVIPSSLRIVKLKYALSEMQGIDHEVGLNENLPDTRMSNNVRRRESKEDTGGLSVVER
mgnify:CR=1 FL=1